MTYFSEAGVLVSDGGNIQAAVDWFHLELVTATPAIAIAADTLEIPAGDAVFVLGGDIEGVAHRLFARNATAIRIRKVSGVWKNSSFSIQYTDSENDTWTLTVSLGEWESAS
jgi:hypothetical protein